MKRYFFSLVAISAIFVSCAKEELKPTTPDSNDGTYSFKALISDASKTSINDDGAMAWITGDKISVYDGAFETFTLKGEASGAEATFTGELTDPSAVALAICPDGIGGEVADEMLTLNLPASYEYDGQSTHAPMIATGFSVNDKTATIQFKHVGGLFKITYNNVPEEAKTFCFEASKQVAGELYIEDYTATEAAIAVDETGTSKSVTYTINSTDNHSSMSFYVPVPVGTFNFNISLKDAEGNKIAKSSKTKNSFTIARGDYVAIPAINMPRKFVEDFSSSEATNDNYDCQSSLSTEANRKDFDYSWSTGTGTVYKNGIKLGSGKANGSTTSSDILADIAAGSIFTVKVYAAVWNKDGGSLVVSYNDKERSLAPTNEAITSTSSAYDESDFTNSTDFVFKKVEGVEDLTVASSTLRILIDKIEIVEGGELPAEPQEFGVSTTSVSATWDETSKTFDITAADVVAWEIVADEGITLSQDEGTGNATITVTFAQNTAETQLSKEIVVSTSFSPVVNEDTYTITLTQAGKPAREMDGDGSATNPYSVADALYLAGNLADNGTTAECYVTGTITDLVNFKDGTYSYTIGTGDDTFEVYKGKDLGNAIFSNSEDIAIAQVVVIYGKIKKYVNSQSGDTTLEMDAGNYLYSIDGATSILKGIAVSGQKTSFTQNEEWSFGGTVTASYRGKEGADVTSNTTFDGYNTANIGEQTVTASYTENEVTKTADYTISVVKEGTVKITEVTAVSQFTPGTYIILTYDEAGYVPNAVATKGGSVLYKTVTKTEGVINITRDMVWTATGDGGSNGLTFESYVNSGKYLWGYNTSDGIRVTDNLTNSGASKVWTLVNDNSYGQKGTFGSSRYLCTYGTQDWRCYTSTSATNKAANFFKIEGWVDPGVTKHTLTINSATNGSIKATVDNEEVESGAQIEEDKTVTITATPDENYEFDEWNVTGATVGSSSTQTFTMTGDVTVGATFKEKQGGGTSKYVKVTSSENLTDGTYLIVCESQNVAFNGSLSTLDAVSNTVAVTISNNEIATSTAVDAAAFTFTASNGSFKGTGGKYFGNASDSNALTSSTTALNNTISISDGNADIVSSGGAYLRYNKTSGQTRFRYYKSSTYTSQQAIQLYKLTN